VVNVNRDIFEIVEKSSKYKIENRKKPRYKMSTMNGSCDLADCPSDGSTGGWEVSVEINGMQCWGGFVLGAGWTGG